MGEKSKHVGFVSAGFVPVCGEGLLFAGHLEMGVWIMLNTEGGLGSGA